MVTVSASSVYMKASSREASQSIDRSRAGRCYSKTSLLYFRKFIYIRKYLYLFYCYIQSLFREKLDCCLFCAEDEVPSVDLSFYARLCRLYEVIYFRALVFLFVNFTLASALMLRSPYKLCSNPWTGSHPTR